MRKSTATLLPSFALWITAYASTSFASPYYSATELNPPLRQYSIDQLVLNNNGQVAGYVLPESNWRQGYGFVYNGSPGGDGGVTPLGGTTAPSGYPAIRDTRPIAISDTGQILSSTALGSYYLYSNGHTTHLSMRPAGFNDAGQVIGMSFRVAPDGTVAPVVYNLSTSTHENIPAVPGLFQTFAFAINGSGQVAGNTFSKSSTTPVYGIEGSGFYFSNGTTTSLGTLGGSSSSVGDINRSGEVVGSSALSSDLISHAFLWVNGRMTDLGTLPGYNTSAAQKINDQGEIVGEVLNLDPSGKLNREAAFLYSDGTMKALNSLLDPGSGWTISSVLSINNLGQILAIGHNSSLAPITGTDNGYVLLTPGDLAAPGEPTFPTIVPEPSSLALYGLMATAAIIRWRINRATSRTRV